MWWFSLNIFFLNIGTSGECINVNFLSPAKRLMQTLHAFKSIHSAFLTAKMIFWVHITFIPQITIIATLFKI